MFAADTVLPYFTANFPREGAWLGQLLGAAWLAMAALNWFSRNALLGGIYGRGIVTANAVLYYVTAMTLLNVVTHQPGLAGVWLLFVPFTLMALLYGWLLLRGPFERDFRQGKPGR